jgi:hypothetical protein
VPAARDAREPGHARRVGVAVVEEHAVAGLQLVAQQVPRLEVPHALPPRAPIAAQVVDGIGAGLALHQPESRHHVGTRPFFREARGPAVAPRRPGRAA